LLKFTFVGVCRPRCMKLGQQFVRPPIRICIESAGLNVHLLPDPFSSEDRL